MTGTAERDRDPRREQLGHKASRGVAVTMGGLWSKTLIQMLSTVVLARLLDPADFGLVAMVMAIVGVADLVRDFGMTGAILQARALDARLWSSVLWFSVALGLVLTAIVAASAPLIAALFDEQRLVVLTLAIAPTLLVNGLAMPMQAKVQRDLRFGTLANVDVVSMAVGVAGSIAAAFAGWGVWSLVVLAGLGQVYRLVALWVAAKPRFGRPRIERRVLPLVTTGGSIFGVQLLNYAARNLDNVFIGQQLGPAALGQYTRAYALFLLPLQQLTGPLGRVALPVLSALQDDADRYRRYIRGAVLVIGYLSLPTYAVLAAVSDPLITVLLGPDWGHAAQIFSILAIAGVAQAIGNVQGWLYITLGRAHRQFAYYLVTRPIVIGGFLVGLWWAGVNGLALVYGLTTLALLVPGFWFAIRGTFVRGGDILRPVLRPALLTPFVFAASWATVQLLDLPEFVELVLGGVAGLVPLGLAIAVPAYRRDLAQIVAFVKKMRRPATAASTGEDA
ncbi:lipopolysaccharide biosynthesis protein [Agromyces larvae]|uniref:Lipopolysaccharide biosynthesis protein n=1 Tax=Agromyces larvae TaxID=2929802 RepID=A0ABY4BYL7_9MICO|nr:lipopolysaccharide biosynthesis protein [Agromyces larvae]UOE44331.1 lipopolysaccharide biosynthesis protein [Agromyces larvae]